MSDSGGDICSVGGDKGTMSPGTRLSPAPGAVDGGGGCSPG